MRQLSPCLLAFLIFLAEPCAGQDKENAPKAKRIEAIQNEIQELKNKITKLEAELDQVRLAAQEEKEAKALFDRMEAAILKCKSLDMNFYSVEVRNDPDRGKIDVFISGNLQFASGKVRLATWSTSHRTPVRPKRKAFGNPDQDPPDLDPEFSRPRMRIEIHDSEEKLVSDGLKLVVVSKSSTEKERHEIQDAPKDFVQSVLVTFARAHMAATGEWEDPQYGKRASVSGFKLGKKGPAFGRDAQVVEYLLKTESGKGEIEAKVWIDLETHLPLSRVVGKESDKTYLREFYRDARLDVEIAPEVFTLPAKKAHKK